MNDCWLAGFSAMWSMVWMGWWSIVLSKCVELYAGLRRGGSLGLVDEGWMLERDVGWWRRDVVERWDLDLGMERFESSAVGL